MRVVATNRASPMAPSQAARPSRISGVSAAFVMSRLCVKEASVVNKANIRPSRHSKAETRCFRCSVRPVRLRVNTVAVIRVGAMVVTSGWGRDVLSRN